MGKKWIQQSRRHFFCLPICRYQQITPEKKNENSVPIAALLRNITSEFAHRFLTNHILQITLKSQDKPENPFYDVNKRQYHSFKIHRPLSKKQNTHVLQRNANLKRPL